MSKSSSPVLNRWGRADAHTLEWMADDALARVRVGEKFASMPTRDYARPDATTLAIQKQAQDEDFVLDQAFSTGETERMLRESDRKRIQKANDAARISVSSEYLRRDHQAEVDAPLDMGFLALSDIDH